MDTIGVGLIGTGYMGKCHALAWNAVRPLFGSAPNVRLVHLAEIDAEHARRKADAFGFEKSTGDWREVVGDPDGRRRLGHDAERLPPGNGHCRA